MVITGHDLRQAIAGLEARFKAGAPGRSAVAPTGELYVAVTSHGQQDDRGIVRWLGLRYAAGKRGTLYWRIVPEIDSDVHGFRIYSRLLISNKWHRPKADAAAARAIRLSERNRS